MQRNSILYMQIKTRLIAINYGNSEINGNSKINCLTAIKHTFHRLFNLLNRPRLQWAGFFTTLWLPEYYLLSKSVLLCTIIIIALLIYPVCYPVDLSFCLHIALYCVVLCAFSFYKLQICGFCHNLPYLQRHCHYCSLMCTVLVQTKYISFLISLNLLIDCYITL